MAQRKMILDLDTGIDDALALAYAVADPRVDLIGIVSSYGNNTLEITT
ncbi:nucleoside hydrolase, partial [Weissella soli]